MDATEALPDDFAGAEDSSTFLLSQFDVRTIAALVPDHPFAPDSEYGRRDCLLESERLRGKWEELFPRDCRPQTGGSGESSGDRRSINIGTPSGTHTDRPDDSGSHNDNEDDDVPGTPPPHPKPPEVADCSCSVPDFLAGHFQIIGQNTSELLRGTSIDGRGGDDTLQGGDQNDVFMGGDGNDRLEPGNGNDSVSGGKGDDTVNGGPGDDIVLGGAGNDIVNGGPGNDTVCGEAGNDTISGGDGHDCISGGTGDDRINGGRGNDTIHGDAGNDFLVGFDGNDWIAGGAGNDTLRGDAGNDTLIGNAGSDLFYFGAVTAHDNVGDFVHGEDRLDMRGMGLTSWALIQSHVTNTQDGVLITMDENTVLIRSVHTLMQSDFVF